MATKRYLLTCNSLATTRCQDYDNTEPTSDRPITASDTPGWSHAFQILSSTNTIKWIQFQEPLPFVCDAPTSSSDVEEESLVIAVPG